MREIELRRSVRKYKNKVVDSTLIKTILNSARMAPSGHNKQPWHFIVVTDMAIKEAIAKTANNQKWMLAAPVFIVSIADIRARIGAAEEIYVDEETSHWELKRVIRDTSIATENILLEAVSLGLGACWVGWYLQKDLRPILGIPDDKFVVGVITLGYPDESPQSRPRKDLGEIVHFEHW